MYIPMTIGGKKYTETSLWTNANPTSSFAAGLITLSSSITDYEFIKIKWAFSTSAQTETNCATMLMPVSELLKIYNAGSSTNRGLMTIGAASSTTYYVRQVSSNNGTNGIEFSSSRQASGGSTTANNNTNIPLEIIGCKFV